MNEPKGATRDPGLLDWCDVLEAELTALHGNSALQGNAPVDESDRLHLVHGAAHRHPTSALCLSGGGVRSATFALGILQGLAHVGVLGRFDYLSTVSGGGYIGGWLTAWLHRQGSDRRAETLRGLDPARTSEVTGGVEPPPVAHVRRHCRYLAPKGGDASADFWTLLATLGRNLFLNWLVLLPLIAATLLVPRMFYGLTHAFEQPFRPYVGLQCLSASPASAVFLTIAFGASAVAVGYLAMVFSGLGSRWSTNRFLSWFLAPLLTGAAAWTLFWASFSCNLRLSWTIGGPAALMAAGWVALAVVQRVLRHRPQPGAIIARAGVRSILGAAAAGTVLGLGAYWFGTYEFGFGAGDPLRTLYAVFAVPIVLALVLFAITVFVGLASADLDDAALEWWSRCGAWVGLALALWVAAGVLMLYMAQALGAATGMIDRALNFGRHTTGAIISVLLPLISSLAGMATRTSVAMQRPSKITQALQQMALPVIVAALLTTIAWVNLRGLEALEYHRDASGRPCVGEAQVGSGRCHPVGAGIGEVMILAVSYLTLGLLMGAFVPANRFSLHGMYRDRLIRTFLGASREDRTPNPFTGFDGQDDLRVHDLADVRPLHVINSTLNVVSPADIGQPEEQAQSFTFSPLHVGNRHVGYRPAAEYGSDGGGLGTGLSLGMALAVSGAAVSPEMGQFSSKSRAFLLTLANARLGLWFGNPPNPKSWRNSDPPTGVGPIVREMLDLPTLRNPYIYLSDGGHYDNLGLCEMVARRCRFIVVSDAGCDPDYRFDDLANAIRRIRLDLGVPIQFQELAMTRDGQGLTNSHVAVGAIRYCVQDGASAPDGTILYLKATLSGDETVDVWNFARMHAAFPHDPTGDQFFDDARFESYRALGFHTVVSAAPAFSRDSGGIGDFVCAVAAEQDRRSSLQAGAHGNARTTESP